MPQGEGQAGTLTDEVISPDAVRAGLEVLYSFDSPGFEEGLVAEIYRAMRRVVRADRKAS